MQGDIRLIAHALDFAAKKHAGQKKKGAEGKLYINHLAEVAALIADATDGEDPALVAAALLHDVVEDQEVTLLELSQRFGPEVAALVSEVTDDRSLPKAERKRRQVETTPRKTNRAKRLKIADKISNFRSLTNDPPPDWSQERRREYLIWGRAVVDGARGVSPQLERLFDETAADLERRLDEDENQ